MKTADLRGLRKLSRIIAAQDERRKKATDYAMHAAWHLRRMNPGTGKGDFDTSVCASALGRFMSLFVHNNWKSGGEFLCIEWAIDRFLGIFVKRQAHQISRIHHELVRRRHSQRKPFDLGFGDRYAFWLPCELEQYDEYANAFVLVCQSQDFLVLDSCRYGERRIHVRELGRGRQPRYKCDGKKASIHEMKKRNMKLEYGDCRDEGYVLSANWGEAHREAQVDRGHTGFHEVTHALWLIRTTEQALLPGDES